MSGEVAESAGTDSSPTAPPARKRWWVRLLVIVGLLGVGGFLGRVWYSGYEFREVSLNGQRDVLAGLEKRPTLKVNSTSQSSLLGVVGLVLVVDDSDNARKAIVFDSSKAVPNLRPPMDLLRIEPVNKVLYDGRVTNTLSTGGAYTSFAGQLDNSQAADIVISEDIYLGYKDKIKIPYDRLRAMPLAPGKEYYFVEGATVISTTYRKYDEVTSKGLIEGAAFKANGKLYMSSKSSAYTMTLAVDFFDVRRLLPAVGGASQQEILALYSKHAGGVMTSQEAAKLSGLLKEASKEGVTKLAAAQLELTID